jgi:3,4-dihydroxy 2-butanone 4-phosphate synthase/GTP cyclohydrolase II
VIEQGVAALTDARKNGIGPNERAIVARVDGLLARLQGRERPDRPFLTLTFAQSVDGSIACAPSAATALSNARSLTVTHLLRARHDAILVGIGTVLADDPLLNVRLVDGPSPRPVVLDSRLRCPPEARLVRGGGAPIVATTMEAPEPAAARLRAAGAEVLRVPADAEGLVDLGAVLLRLRRAGTRSVMVEGGGRVITSVLRAHVADHLVLTIAPLLLGGYRAVNPLARADLGSLPQLRDVEHTALGDDLVVSASLQAGHG